jgi:hypothetical protein
MPQPGDAPTGKAPALGPPTGPGICPPEDAALGTMVIAPGSSDIVDFRANELGLLGYPRVPPVHQLEVGGGKCGADLHASCSHEATAKADIGYSGLGCSTTNAG